MGRKGLIAAFALVLAACGGGEEGNNGNNGGANNGGSNNGGSNNGGSNNGGSNNGGTNNGGTNNGGTNNGGTNNGGTNNGGTNNGGTNNGVGVTYYSDVAPIFRDNCWGCHYDGGVGPFQLDDYESAKNWGTGIKEVTQSRQMPPQRIVADGSCNEWESAGWLTDDELATIAEWVDTGMEAGDAADMPEPNPADAGLSDANSITVQIPELYQPVALGTPGVEFDDYRCFLIDPNLDADKFITAHQVQPDNAAVVHHLLMFTVTPDQVVGQNNGQPVTNADVIAALDGASPDQLGWPCTPLAGDNVVISGMPVTWAPGQGTVRFPADTGVFVSKDDMLVVQVHYNLVNDQGPDQTSVKLEVADQVTRAGFIDLQDDFLGAAAAGNPTVIPAGEAAFDVEWSQSVDGLLDYYGSLVGANLPYVDVYGFLPHMHGRGVKERVMITGGDADVCLGQIDDWDFNWQFMYWYQQPVRLERGSNQSIQTTCTYDTSNEAGPVYPGFGTDAEMCLIGMYVVLP